ncbi:MAG TPA: DUF2721 domain-containing protein [Thermoanaerobaculia bacterium]|jgi:hypothetical protein|nr:DUF2721 domain-containing protein [Thermoanaerobaculia bacterium]
MATLPPEAPGELVHLLQTSISPIALISGVGLLLLSMTNRLSRVIDRSRSLSAQLRAPLDEAAHARDRAQLAVLARRARLLWASIAAVMVTVLSSCTMVLLLTTMAFLHLDLRLLVVVLFFVAVLALLVSSVVFFADVLLSLRALRTEIGEVWR